MQLAIVGSGYVGLVSGACLADFGHQVVCVDSDAAKIDALRNGDIPIFEPGLRELVAGTMAAGRLGFETDLGPAVAEADAIFIAVGTPSRRGDGHADLTYVFEAARQIAAHLSGSAVIITKSTVPVGTGDEVERIMREARPDLPIVVVSNPEFLREGAAIEDFKHPDRIIVGVEDERAKQVMSEIYRPLYLNQAPLLFTTRRTAELTKYAANAFLAMKITFINEMADLCEATGANVQEVARGIGLDKRIGSKFLNAGPGYGGSCFPKDTLALVKTGRDFESPLRLVETTIEVNENRRVRMVEKVIGACGGNVAGKRLGVLGLTFKPNTDDLRDAPALDIVRGLMAEGAQVAVYDPEGMPGARSLLPDATFADDAYDVARDAEAVVLITEWNEFRSLDLGGLKSLMLTPTMVDLRNVYRHDEMARHGFRYRSVGRPGDDLEGEISP